MNSTEVLTVGELKALLEDVPDDYGVWNWGLDYDCGADMEVSDVKINHEQRRIEF